MRISVSQIKTFLKSKAEWAGKYCLWLRETLQEDFFIIWHVFEDWILTWEDTTDKYRKEIKNINTFNEELDNLKFNSTWLIDSFEVWELQKEIKWELLWADFIWYIDNFTKDCIYDIKTAKYLAKDDWKISMFSWLTKYDEYKLQLWVYSQFTWVRKTAIIEVAKHKYVEKKPTKKEPNPKPRYEHQIIEFYFDEEEDKKMEKRYWKIVKEMGVLYNKFYKKNY